MAVYKLFPEKDASIYSQFPLLNTGVDEILDVSTFFTSADPQVSRFLIKFSQSEIEDVLTNKIGTASFQSNLKTYIADITGLNSTTTLEVYPASGSWNMGTGRYSSLPQTQNGVCWTSRLSANDGNWPTTFTPYVTASYQTATPGGGTWYTGSSLGLNVTQSQELSYSSDKDLNVDVTNTVLTWYSGSNSLGGFLNDGFIVKQSNSDEFVANRNYVTFARELPKDGKKGYTEGSVNPFKRIKGSKERVFPPLDAIVKNTNKIVNLAERNQVKVNFIDFIAKKKGEAKKR